jgi:hypothetical protein
MPQEKKSDSLFKQYGGRMTTRQIEQFLNRMTMHPWEREYIKRVFERYHSPVSPHITEEEFKQGLDEMLKNTRDPVERNRIEQIKRKFGL